MSLNTIGNIMFDDHAIRQGESPVGYIVILVAGPEIVTEDEEDPQPRFSVGNRLFPDKESAVRHALQSTHYWRPIVKALRASE